MTDDKLKDREADMLIAVKQAHDNGFDGFITGRMFKRSTAEKLVTSGHLAKVRLVVADGDGWALEPERERDGYSLTDPGRTALAGHVFAWEIDEPGQAANS